MAAIGRAAAAFGRNKELIGLERDHAFAKAVRPSAGIVTSSEKSESSRLSSNTRSPALTTSREGREKYLRGDSPST